MFKIPIKYPTTKQTEYVYENIPKKHVAAKY